MRTTFLLYCLYSLLVIGALSFLWPPALWASGVLGLVFLCGLYDMFQRTHSLWRNYPFIGRGRWLMEILRPPLRQYFIESDIEGVPLNRMFRSVVYQRSKKELDTVPFGTKLDLYRVGYEWMNHSLMTVHGDELQSDPRVQIGGRDCTQPYSASIFNISAMSFGALSKNAIRALNGGAKQGGFAHNTGEGGISPYHLETGGDLIWQVGTGYFGCRDPEGRFSPELFMERSSLDQVKMIEIKLSQGAKPGHGGILPAEKNTPEIAAIRGVPPHTRIDSPPAHSAFTTPLEMMRFISKLRTLSGGKPIGFKLSIGRRSEFIALCKAMIRTGIKPDFITIDGGEGGTGAAPLEYTNSVGTPLRDGLAFAVDCLMGYDLKDSIKVIASGKILTGFHIVKHLALGADLCNSARGMMLSLGCIQSLECNKNTCPVGVATQNPRFVKGLVVTDKVTRVANYHRETVHSVVELLAASGLEMTEDFNRSHINRRISQAEVKRYDQIFPYVMPGIFLDGPIPENFEKAISEASAESFAPLSCLVCCGDRLTRMGDLVN